MQTLHKTFPPTNIIHIGVGYGGSMHQWREWDVPRAALIDADPACLEWAGNALNDRRGWCAMSVILGQMDGQAEFFHASNPAESGLLQPEKLVRLWPNLHTVGQERREVTKLDTLMASLGQGPGQEDEGLWLLVDCLPALSILQGGAATLARCSVLWLRALLQPVSNAETGSTLAELESFLHPLGFRCIDTSESNHPAIGEVVFVRDWIMSLRPAQNEIRALLHEKNTLTQERLALSDELATLRASHAKQAALWQAQLQEASKALAEQTDLASRCQAQTEASDNEKKGLLAANALLQQEKNVLSETCGKLSEAVEQRLEQLRQAQAALAEQTDVLGQCQLRTGALEDQAKRQLAANALLQQEKDALNETCTRVSETAARQQEQLQHLEGKLTEQTALASQRQNRIDALEEESKGQLAANALLQQEKTSLSETCNNLSETAAQNQARWQETQTALAEQTALGKQYQSRIEAFEVETKALLAANALLQQEKNALSETCDRLSESVAQKQEELKQKQTALTEQTELSRQCQSRIEAFEVETKALLAANALLQQEKNALSETCDRLSESAAQKQEELKQKQTALAEQTELGQQCQTRIAAMEVEYKALLAANALLQQEMEALEERGSADMAAASELKAMLAQRQSHIDALEAERTALQTSYAALQKEQSALTGNHQTLTKEVAALKAELVASQKRLEQALSDQGLMQQNRDSLVLEKQKFEALINEKDQRLKEMDAELSASSHRQQQLNEELIRAEAQIDLIKDVLLREQGL